MDKKKKKKFQINDLVSYLCEEKKNIIRFFSDCDYSVEDEREFFFSVVFFFSFGLWKETNNNLRF